MLKKFTPIVTAIAFFSVTAFPSAIKNTDTRHDIRRLTYSENNVAQYPCLSDDGRFMLYFLDIKDGEETTISVRFMNVEDGKEKELFRCRTRRAPAPFEDVSLIMGTKPPALSGDGSTAVFSLSLDEPANILDHYLAVVNTEGTNFTVIRFPFDALKGKYIKSLDFSSGDWERVSAYTISSDGNRIACVLKGHLGPRRYGNPSGLVFIDTTTKKQRTILAPDFIEDEWKWSTSPRRPLSGGGWAFGMSGDGERVVFGAQSSPNENDYDLYIVNWDGKDMKRITDFHDRWFSLADISQDGKNVVFFYGGRLKQGIGTYTVNIEPSELKHLESKQAPRVDFFDMSGNGRYLLFKHVYKGMMYDLHTGQEMVAFDKDTPGYAAGLTPMDFPRFPSFWGPRIMNFKGDRVLLVGPPQGKESPEIYLLRIDLR